MINELHFEVTPTITNNIDVTLTL